jgi:fructose-bisphosphate aldolase, class I
MVVFSGGEAKTLNDVYQDVRAIRDGGGNGSIMGRNAFQRPKNEALVMFKEMIEILLGRKA